MVTIKFGYACHRFPVQQMLTSLSLKVVLKLKIKLMKEKALRKHRLQEKTTAASVLLKLFISSNQ